MPTAPKTPHRPAQPRRPSPAPSQATSAPNVSADGPKNTPPPSTTTQTVLSSLASHVSTQRERRRPPKHPTGLDNHPDHPQLPRKPRQHPTWAPTAPKTPHRPRQPPLACHVRAQHGRWPSRSLSPCPLSRRLCPRQRGGCLTTHLAPLMPPIHIDHAPDVRWKAHHPSCSLEGPPFVSRWPVEPTAHLAP